MQVMAVDLFVVKKLHEMSGIGWSAGERLKPNDVTSPFATAEYTQILEHRLTVKSTQ